MSSPAVGRTVDIQGGDLNRYIWHLNVKRAWYSSFAIFMYSLHLCRGENSRGRSTNALPLPASQDKNENAGALVKSSNEKIKTTPAGEYLTAALADFDPDQFESFAAISDGANKLLMLV